MAPPELVSGGSAAAKRTAIALLLLSEIAAMATWFATTASVGAIRTQWSLTPFQEALLTNSVQAGFVVGTLISALLGLADRFDLRPHHRAGARPGVGGGRLRQRLKKSL